MRRGEINLQGIMYSMLVVGLFVSLISAWVLLNGSNYDVEGYDQSDLENYAVLDNLSSAISSIEQSVDQTTIDSNAFDFFANVFNTILSPFKFAYRSFKTLISIGNTTVDDLKLLPVFAEFAAAIITLFVIIGIVMIKFYMGRNK